MIRTLSRLTTVVFLALASSCVSDQATGRFERHACAGVWADAFLGVAEDPWQLGTAATFAAALPVAFANDASWSKSAIDNTHFSSHASNGNRVLDTMMASAGAVALGEWFYGDDGGAATEVLLESAILTSGIVKLIKRNHSRRRPEGSGSYDSFPSGHATMAFVTATFLARRIDDNVEGWLGNLGYLTYVPAALVMLNRVENARHYPSDVFAGALLGSLVTNVLYNAHYGSEHRQGIYTPPPVSVVTEVDGDYVGLGLRVRF